MAEESISPATPCPGCGAALAAGAVLCIECGFDKRKGRRLDTVHARPRGRKRSQEGRAPGLPRPERGRAIVAWLLIALGLTGVVGGGGMIYIHSLIPPAVDGVVRDGGKIYAIAIFSILLGLVLTCYGVGLRPDRRRKRSGSDRPGAETDEKLTCPACGGRSPATAPNCYQCGRAFAVG